MAKSASKKKNRPMPASLIAGMAAALLMVFYFIPGPFSLLGLAGALTGLLAVLAGLRDLRSTRRGEKQLKTLAYISLGLGVLSLAAFGIAAALGANQSILHVRKLLPSQTKTYQGEGFTLRYPEDWEMGDTARQPLCGQEGIECPFTLIHPDKESTTLSLARYELAEPATVQELDDFFWDMFLRNTPGANLESRNELRVAGQPAVQRVFNAPSIAADGERRYLVQTVLVKDAWFYQFTGWTTSLQARSNLRPVFEEIIRSLKFTR